MKKKDKQTSKKKQKPFFCQLCYGDRLKKSADYLPFSYNFSHFSFQIF